MHTIATNLAAVCSAIFGLLLALLQWFGDVRLKSEKSGVRRKCQAWLDVLERSPLLRITLLLAGRALEAAQQVSRYLISKAAGTLNDKPMRWTTRDSIEEVIREHRIEARTVLQMMNRARNFYPDEAFLQTVENKRFRIRAQLRAMQVANLFLFAIAFCGFTVLCCSVAILAVEISARTEIPILVVLIVSVPATITFIGIWISVLLQGRAGMFISVIIALGIYYPILDYLAKLEIRSFVLVGIVITPILAISVVPLLLIISDFNSNVSTGFMASQAQGQLTAAKFHARFLGKSISLALLGALGILLVIFAIGIGHVSSPHELTQLSAQYIYINILGVVASLWLSSLFIKRVRKFLQNTAAAASAHAGIQALKAIALIACSIVMLGLVSIVVCIGSSSSSPVALSFYGAINTFLGLTPDGAARRFGPRFLVMQAIFLPWGCLLTVMLLSAVLKFALHVVLLHLERAAHPELDPFKVLRAAITLAFATSTVATAMLMFFS